MDIIRNVGGFTNLEACTVKSLKFRGEEGGKGPNFTHCHRHSPVVFNSYKSDYKNKINLKQIKIMGWFSRPYLNAKITKKPL